MQNSRDCLETVNLEGHNRGNLDSFMVDIFSLRGNLFCAAHPSRLENLRKAYLAQAQQRFCLYALALTALSVFVSMGFQTQAAAMLGTTEIAIHRNWALIPQMVFAVWVVQKLPIRNLPRWLAISGALLLVTLWANPDGTNTQSFVLSTIAGSFQTSLSWKLCARTFPNSMQGQGAQNLCCLSATAIAGSLALNLHGFSLYVAVSAIGVVFACCLVQPFECFLEIQNPQRQACLKKWVSLKNLLRFQKEMDYPKVRVLWASGISMLYPVSMAVKGQADGYTLEVARHLGDGYASIESGASVLACLAFTVQPATYTAIAKRVGGEGRLMAGAGVIAAFTYILSGLVIAKGFAGGLGWVALAYALRAIAGVCFEIFERGSEVLSDELAHGRRNEFAAGMLVMVLYRPAQYVASIPMLLHFDPSGCFVVSGFFLLIATIFLIMKGELIGRTFLNYAGPKL